MTITISGPLAQLLQDQAQRRGVAPERLAIETLEQRFAARGEVIQPRDAWEESLVGAVSRCGVSLSIAAARRRAAREAAGLRAADRT